MTDVAAVIPVRNGARFLRGAVESVVVQRPAPREVIIVDDGSEDGTEGLARALPGVTHVLRTTRLGPGGARNLGVRWATTAYVAFLDADDRWLAGKLSACLTTQRHTGCELAVGSFRYVRADDDPIPPGFDSRLLQGEHLGPIASTLFASRALLVSHPFDESFVTAEDVEWFGRLAALGIRPQHVPGCWVEKTIHRSNLSLTHPAQAQELFRALRKNLRAAAVSQSSQSTREEDVP
jgi:glycosyltransferase involved in cell wall biosynthesis